MKLEKTRKQCIEDATVPIYIINLKRRKDRRAHVIEEVQKMGWSKFTLCHAIDARDMKTTKLKENSHPEVWKTLQSNFREKHRDPTVGAIGCAMSHALIWSEIVVKRNREALILEDDVLFESRWKNSPFDAPLPCDYDVLLFGAIVHETWSPIDEPRAGWIRVKNFWCLHCYIITPKAASLLSSLVWPVRYHIDYLMSQHSNELKIYALQPSFARVHPQLFQISDIYSPCKEPCPVYYPLGQLMRALPMLTLEQWRDLRNETCEVCEERAEFVSEDHLFCCRAHATGKCYAADGFPESLPEIPPLV